MNEPDGDGQIAVPQPEVSPPNASGPPPGMLLQASWSAPLPPPGALQQYDAIVPGAADRILRMAENVQQHNIELEKAASAREDKTLALADKTITSDASQSRWGLWFAFIIALLGIGVGAWLISIDKAGFGLAAIIAPLASLAGLFVYGTESRKAERRRNSANRPEE